MATAVAMVVPETSTKDVEVCNPCPPTFLLHISRPLTIDLLNYC